MILLYTINNSIKESLFKRLHYFLKRYKIQNDYFLLYNIEQLEVFKVYSSSLIQNVNLNNDGISLCFKDSKIELNQMYCLTNVYGSEIFVKIEEYNTIRKNYEIKKIIFISQQLGLNTLSIINESLIYNFNLLKSNNIFLTKEEFYKNIEQNNNIIFNEIRDDREMKKLIYFRLEKNLQKIYIIIKDKQQEQLENLLETKFWKNCYFNISYPLSKFNDVKIELTFYSNDQLILKENNLSIKYFSSALKLKNVLPDLLDNYIDYYLTTYNKELYIKYYLLKLIDPNIKLFLISKINKYDDLTNGLLNYNLEHINPINYIKFNEKGLEIIKVLINQYEYVKKNNSLTTLINIIKQWIHELTILKNIKPKVNINKLELNQAILNKIKNINLIDDIIQII